MTTLKQAQLSADISGDLLTEARKIALITFLTRELTPIVPEVLLADLTGANSLPGKDSPSLLAWDQAFTHQSVSGRNYERVETQGDAILKAQFIYYIGLALPSVVTPGQLTDFVAYYLSKTYLSRLGMIRGMDKIVKVARDLNEIAVDIAEDVFEAFVGTLFELGNKYGPAALGYPAGAILVGNYIAFLFNPLELAADSVKSAAKVQLGIREDKLKWKIFTLQFSQRGKQVQTYQYTSRRNLLPQAANFLDPERIQVLKDLFEREGLDKDDPDNNQTALKSDEYYLIGSAGGDDKQASEENSAKDALKFLDAAGFTSEYADQVKKNRDYKASGFREVSEPIEAKYGEFFFRTKNLSNLRTLHMLIINLSDGSEYQIAHIIVPKSNPVKDTRLRLLSLAQAVLGRPVPEIPRKITTLGEVKGAETNRDIIKGQGKRGNGGRGNGRGGRSNQGGRGGYQGPNQNFNQGYQGQGNFYQGGYQGPNQGGYQGQRNFNQGGYQGGYQGPSQTPTPGGYQGFIQPNAGPYQGGYQGNNQGPRQGNRGRNQRGPNSQQGSRGNSANYSQGGNSQNGYNQVSNSPPHYGFQLDTNPADLPNLPTTPPPVVFLPTTPTQPPAGVIPQ